MARKDSRQPFRNSYQWIALILLGVALGSAIRIATAGPPHGLADAAHPASAAPPPASPAATDPTAPPVRHPRPATAAHEAPPLSAEQVALLLDAPSAYRPDFIPLLLSTLSQPPPAPASIAALAELFGWEEDLSGLMADALHRYVAQVTALIDQGAILQPQAPGTLEVSFEELAEEHSAALEALAQECRSLIGPGATRQLDAIGFFRELEAGLPESLFVQISPLEGSSPAIVQIRVVREEERDSLIATTNLRQHPESGAWQGADALSLLLPPIDWNQEIERLPTPPQASPE
jgi:hypothetical protein